MRVSRAAFRDALAKTKARKARRAENKGFQVAVKATASGSRLTQDATLGVKGPLTPRTIVRRRRRKPSAKATALKTLKGVRNEFVLLRGKYRTGGRCEVGMVCRGTGAIEVVYHVFPAAMGNAIKHDARNLLAACSSCNGGEYFARKRGASEVYHARHRAILGDALWSELRDLQGRKQLNIVEIREMTAAYRKQIETGAWRLRSEVEGTTASGPLTLGASGEGGQSS